MATIYSDERGQVVRASDAMGEYYYIADGMGTPTIGAWEAEESAMAALDGEGEAPGPDFEIDERGERDVETLVEVRGSHASNHPHRFFWVDPVGWEPKLPEEFRDDPQYEVIEGAVFGDGDEAPTEAGLVYLGEIEEHEVKTVSLDDLCWARCGGCDWEGLGDVEVKG
jgi:hypothetical protein